MQAAASGLWGRLISALALGGGLCCLFAGEVRLTDGELRLKGLRFQVRGVSYAPLAIGAHPEDSVPPCAYARDLPLIAALGANVVRTDRLLASGDGTFVPLLETTGLYWLAGFPLEPFYDSSRPFSERHAEILDAFRAYAKRFQGERRLLGYVFGNAVAENFSGKFAGSAADFYALLGEAAGVLRELEPEGTPLLSTATGDLAELRNGPEGLDFWLYNPGPARSLPDTLGASAKPVLVSPYGASLEDELGQAQAALGLTLAIEADRALLGGVYAAFADDSGSLRRLGIFRLVPTPQEGFDSLRPRAVYRTLAGLWGGHIPADWLLEDEPRLERITNAASEGDEVAPGAIVRVTGKALEGGEFAANGIPWPFHLGPTCLCVGDKAVPLDMVSPEAATAQIPWDLPIGEPAAVLYRAGVATNFVKTQVRQYAPGIFPGGVTRAGTSCQVSAANGVRPGEALEVYATGLGPGAPSWATPVALINGTPAEVLYSGTLPNFVGLHQVHLRVSPQTPPASFSTLELNVEETSSNLYPLSVSSLADRFGISLQPSLQDLLLQAGGPGKVVEVHAAGMNGYCGPVLFAAAAAPRGVSFRTAGGFTGQKAALEVRAAATAPPRSDAEMILYGYAAGAASGLASLHVTILPSRGDINVRVISAGFNSGSFARFDWSGRTLFSAGGGGPGRGINVLVIDASTGIFSPAQSFDTWGDRTASARLVEYLAGLPAGSIALFAVADDGSLLLTSQTRASIASMFGSRFIQGLAYQQSWAMIGRKGATSPVAENASSTSQVILQRLVTFP